MDQAKYERLLAKARRTIDLFTFDEFIRFWGEDRPDTTALDGDDLSLTYGELEDATARVASALLAMGRRVIVFRGSARTPPPISPCSSARRAPGS
jgi:hypothetical protein